MFGLRFAPCKVVADPIRLLGAHIAAGPVGPISHVNAVRVFAVGAECAYVSREITGAAAFGAFSVAVVAVGAVPVAAAGGAGGNAVTDGTDAGAITVLTLSRSMAVVAVELAGTAAGGTFSPAGAPGAGYPLAVIIILPGSIAGGAKANATARVALFLSSALTDAAFAMTLTAAAFSAAIAPDAVCACSFASGAALARPVAGGAIAKAHAIVAIDSDFVIVGSRVSPRFAVSVGEFLTARGEPCAADSQRKEKG